MGTTMDDFFSELAGETPARLKQMGLACMLPGWVQMHEELGRKIQEARTLLAAADAEIPDMEILETARPRRGRPPKTKTNTGWPADREARKAEMKRRQAVAARKKAGGAAEPDGDEPKPKHPRDPRHPGHDAWVKKLRAAQKKRWKSFTPAQQKAQLRKMTKGRSETARAAVEEMKAAS
jgi:hypothetical protein